MMLSKLNNILTALALLTTIAAVPAVIPTEEELTKKDNHPDIQERQVITCGYYEICYCPRNGVRWRCRDPKGCSMTCYPS